MITPLVRAQAGDDRAFGRLLEHHRHGLELYCYLMLGDSDTARRAMAEAMLTAWRERELAEPRKSVRVWLYGIAVRVCFDAVGDTATGLGADSL